MNEATERRSAVKFSVMYRRTVTQIKPWLDWGAWGLVWTPLLKLSQILSCKDFTSENGLLHKPKRNEIQTAAAQTTTEAGAAWEGSWEHDFTLPFQTEQIAFENFACMLSVNKSCVDSQMCTESRSADHLCLSAVRWREFNFWGHFWHFFPVWQCVNCWLKSSPITHISHECI